MLAYSQPMCKLCDCLLSSFLWAGNLYFQHTSDFNCPNHGKVFTVSFPTIASEEVVDPRVN